MGLKSHVSRQLLGDEDAIAVSEQRMDSPRHAVCVVSIVSSPELGQDTGDSGRPGLHSSAVWGEIVIIRMIELGGYC